MAKDPAFLFYPGDYLAGTMGMTFAEKGAYVELLMNQFNKGHLSEFWVKRILKDDYELFWPLLREKFTFDKKGDWYNKRLEEEQIKRKNHTNKQTSNIRKRWSGNTKAIPTEYQKDTKPIPLEDEIENTIVYKNEDIKKIEKIRKEVSEFFKITELNQFDQWARLTNFLCGLDTNPNINPMELCEWDYFIRQFQGYKAEKLQTKQTIHSIEKYLSGAWKAKEYAGAQVYTQSEHGKSKEQLTEEKEHDDKMKAEVERRREVDGKDWYKNKESKNDLPKGTGSGTRLKTFLDKKLKS